MVNVVLLFAMLSVGLIVVMSLDLKWLRISSRTDSHSARNHRRRIGT